MQVLHTNEYIKIVEAHYGFRPSYTDFNKFEVCKSLIKKIPLKKLNDCFVSVMKERKIENKFTRKEKFLNQIYYS